MIEEGDRIPSATVKEKTSEGVHDIATEDFFKGRRVVLFGLPGAFTQTCSARHLPGFVQRADEVKAKGVDEIACMAVNDAHVMNAWGVQQGVDGKVRMLADGNAEFSRKLGMEIDRSEIGYGTRCQRFAMIVEDGTVQKLFMDKVGEFDATSVENVLRNL